MKISIKVTVSEITQEERTKKKRFATRVYHPDKNEYRVTEGKMSLIERDVIDSILMRLEQDRKNLIRWEEDDGDVVGSIEIIPAVDYTPSND